MIRRWNPDTLAPPIGQYSHLASVPAGHELVMISGQVGALPDGTLAGPDAKTQTRQIFANIERLLDSLGAGPHHVVKLFTLVAGAEDIEGCRAARAETFAKWYPDGDWPAHSLAVVTALAAPELTVEIEGVAALARR